MFLGGEDSKSERDVGSCSSASAGVLPDASWTQVSNITRTTRSRSPRAGGKPLLDVPKSMAWSSPEWKYEVVRVWRRDSSRAWVIGHAGDFSGPADAPSSSSPSCGGVKRYRPGMGGGAFVARE